MKTNLPSEAEIENEIRLWVSDSLPTNEMRTRSSARRGARWMKQEAQSLLFYERWKAQMFAEWVHESPYYFDSDDKLWKDAHKEVDNEPNKWYATSELYTHPDFLTYLETQKYEPVKL